MFKVMIIDDEPIIVQGLSRGIAWDKYECEVVAIANDGEEGLELIKTYNPDILFMDIRMPRMDGLTMLAAIKSEFEHIEVSILTGFRDFDYAQRALTLGVTRFLLKPSNMEELLEAIESMVSNLRKKMEQKIILENMVQTKEKNNSEQVASSFIVKNALSYIEENYKEKLLLTDVAEKTYVSQWHLSKLLNKHTGQTFSEILNSVRIEKAKELLKDPSLRIGDVAEQVGFLDIAHFSRVFKKQIGVSANEFRNTNIRPK
ncbi:MAG: response regulator transcription factor [Lachnospiraceae bacterium]